MAFVDVVGVAPWVVASAAITWAGTMLAHGRETRKINLEHAATIDVSRDDLAIELLSSARSEIVTARAEMEGLRDELKSLRAMEQHFYHFQQALEHLSAVLFSKTSKERVSAERNARAFLTRMVRLRDAKGTIANETQRVDSSLKVAEAAIRKEGGQV
jgi:alpha-amylase/alpha-mannosidase (GH57 family)